MQQDSRMERKQEERLRQLEPETLRPDAQIAREARKELLAARRVERE